MADYESIHTGKNIDDGITRARKLSDAELDLLEKMSNNTSNGGLFYKDSLGTFKAISSPDLSRYVNGALYINGGKIAVGSLSDKYISTSAPKKYVVSGLYDKVSSISCQEPKSGNMLVKAYVDTVDNLVVTIYKYEHVVQMKVEFTMPKGAVTLSGNFSNICIAKLKTSSAPFNSLGISKNTLKAMTSCSLTTAASGPSMHGYLGTEGGIYICGIGGTEAKLRAGKKITLTGTYLCK